MGATLQEYCFIREEQTVTKFQHLCDRHEAGDPEASRQFSSDLLKQRESEETTSRLLPHALRDPEPCG